MTDKILQKYTERSGVADSDATTPEVEVTENLGCFGWFRGIQDRAIMLELRKKTGAIVAIGYGWIERVDFDPSDGIVLYALGQKICIKGRNLNADVREQVSLFNGVCRHRVPWIQEVDEPGRLQAGERATIVEEIVV
ncbi:MAG TPA: hypothetical protein VGG19_06415 [Tepidisphaeraceae bacterium]|jgi:hypothetical protein